MIQANHHGIASGRVLLAALLTIACTAPKSADDSRVPHSPAKVTLDGGQADADAQTRTDKDATVDSGAGADGSTLAGSGGGGAAAPSGTADAGAHPSAGESGSGTHPNSAEVCPAGSWDGDANSATPCVVCAAGSFCPGGSAEPVECAAGTWDHDDDPATACAAWRDCQAGTAVGNTPSATADRLCEPCAAGTFSGELNQSPCLPYATCPPGTYVAGLPSSTLDRSCAVCTNGYSSTSDANSCSLWSTCMPGTYVTTAPSATRDRGCTACKGGFSASNNASACTLWTVCGAGKAEITAPTATSDRECSEYFWTTTYGSTSNDQATGVTVSGTSLYVSGLTEGTLPDKTPLGGTSDAILVKFTTGGSYVWSQQFGTGEADVAAGVAVDNQGGIYVVGTLGQYNGASNDNRNGFLHKYADSSGALQWSRTFGLYGMNSTLVWDGKVLAAGLTTTQPFVKVFDTSGTEQAGLSVSTGGYGPERMAIDAKGDYLYLGGHTYEALDSQSNNGWTDVFIRKHDTALLRVSNGTSLFGTTSTDYAADLAVDGPGNIYISGRMSAGTVKLGAATLAQVARTYSAFVSAFNSSLNHLWTQVVYLGPNESFYGLAGAAEGGVYVTGKDTLRKYDTSGNLVFGHGLDGATGRDLFMTQSGELYLVGERSGDMFIARVAP